MDDFNLQSLRHAQNDQCSRLLDILTPTIFQGFQFIFDEAVRTCNDSGEPRKYLKTFQNLILRVPKWNATIISTECERIMKESDCSYLEDLITCTHIIHLKMLTIARVGNKQKTVDIDIPKINDFIHRVYIESARRIYKATFLYEAGLPSLQQQKNRHELEYLIKDAILTVVRESIPTERILRAYMNDAIEEDVSEEIKEEIIPGAPRASAPPPTPPAPSESSGGALSFDNTDHAVDIEGKQETIHAPKDIDVLETISQQRHEQRKAEEAEEDNADDTIVIGEDLSMQDMDLDIQRLDYTAPPPAVDSTPTSMNIEILD